MTASAWTEDRVDRLKTLWLEGRTAEQIAREFDNGISRNAVLGKVHRLGLSAGRPARVRSRTPPGRSPAKPGKRPPAVGGEGRTDAPRARRAAAPDESVCALPASYLTASDLPSGGLSLLAVRRGQCRWPYGDPEAGLTFCGRPVARGAFCAGHAAIGYRTPRGGSSSLLALAGLD